MSRYTFLYDRESMVIPTTYQQPSVKIDDDEARVRYEEEMRQREEKEKKKKDDVDEENKDSHCIVTEFGSSRQQKGGEMTGKTMSELELTFDRKVTEDDIFFNSVLFAVINGKDESVSITRYADNHAKLIMKGEARELEIFAEAFYNRVWKNDLEIQAALEAEAKRRLFASPLKVRWIEKREQE